MAQEFWNCRVRFFILHATPSAFRWHIMHFAQVAKKIALKSQQNMDSFKHNIKTKNWLIQDPWLVINWRLSIRKTNRKTLTSLPSFSFADMNSNTMSKRSTWLSCSKMSQASFSSPTRIRKKVDLRYLKPAITTVYHAVRGSHNVSLCFKASIL